MLIQERERTATGEAWAARPRTARALRILAWVAPIGLSILTTALLAHSFPRPRSGAGVVIWWIALSGCATAVLAVTDRAARRLLPLMALFNLSLVFPDQAPSRFKAALRAGTVRQLEERVAQVKAKGLSSDPILAAETLIELVAALSQHDRVTRGHAERVRAYARMIGEEMGLDPDDLDRLQWAGLLHDVGKLFVPAEILNKPGLLTDEEYAAVKIHPTAGAMLCEPLRGWLGDWVDAVGQHHEKWDGSGYPRGLAGEDISLAARIVSVADVYDVITSARSYKAPCTPVQAREELASCAGTHFDARVVRAFLSVSLGRLRMVMGPLSWLAQVPVLGQAAIVPAASMAGSGLVTASALMFGGFVDAPRVAPAREAVEQVAPAPDDGESITTRPGATVDGQPVIDDPTTTTTAGPDGSTSTTARDGSVAVVPGDATTTTTSVANERPVANDDAYTTGSAQTVIVPAPGVLANDRDADGDALAAALVSSPSHGAVTLSRDGSLKYQPASGFVGTDSLRYAVDDGHGGTGQATVAITVVPAPTETTGTWYLGWSTNTATTWGLTSAVGPLTAVEPDYEGDGAPGLTIHGSDQKVDRTNADDFQEWMFPASTSLHVSGSVRLLLWSAMEAFTVRDNEYSVWLEDCPASGSGCTVLASQVHVKVNPWNNGTIGWGYREISLGSIDHTIATGRKLTLRVMFKEDTWVALSAPRPSRLIIN